MVGRTGAHTGRHTAEGSGCARGWLSLQEGSQLETDAAWRGGTWVADMAGGTCNRLVFVTAGGWSGSCS